MTSSPASSSKLLSPIPPSPLELQEWLQRHLSLLRRERAAELQESHLLLSSTSPRILEANGLALCRLGVLSVAIGSGGKRLVELHRPTAYHTDSKFPPNGFRSGDVVVLVDEAADNGNRKAKKASEADENRNAGLEAVVITAGEAKIVVSLSKAAKQTGSEEEDLPSRCRLVKVANEVTWER